MGTLTNSEEPDEMQHNAAFHQVLHCLLIVNLPSWTEIHHHNLENSTCDRQFGTQWTVPYLFYWENPSEYKQLNICSN